VYGVDPNRDVTNLLNAGRAPVEEPGLQELLDLHHSRLICTEDAVHVASKCEFLFLIVPTPSQADGTFSSRILEETLVPIAEAMLALVLMDHYLRHRAQNADVRCLTPVVPGSA
jgi:UDP-glucose 6-dehydrogenase